MPQMAPLNWLILLIYFISILIYINILNYYIINFKNHYYKLTQTKMNLIWKW